MYNTYKGQRREPVTVVLLSLFTCGIYYIYWLWKVKEDINGALGREEITTLDFILAIFIPFLILLYFSKIDKGIMEICGQRGMPSESHFLLWLVLYFFGIGMFICEYQTQETLNNVWSNTP